MKMITEKRGVLMLPVGANCNLRCVYCYHGKIRNGQFRIMSKYILEKAIKDSFNFSPLLDFIWHGGEPLLAGLPFFQKAVEYQKKYSRKSRFKNIVQTNATLIDKEWAEFFEKNRFFVSTSIDGPDFIHDKNRRFVTGNGPFAQVIKGISRVRRKQGIGIIAIVSRTNVDYPKEVYKTLRKIGNRGFKLHLLSETDAGLKELIPDKESTVNFLKTIFDLWIEEDDPSFQIRTFVDMIRAYLGGRVINCAAGYDRCRLFVAVSSNGDIYPCQRFLSYDEFRLGNILEKSIGQIVDGAKGIYQEMSQLPMECSNCKWIDWCGGDCSYDRWINNKNFSSLSPNCQVFQEIFKHVEKRVGEISKNKKAI